VRKLTLIAASLLACVALAACSGSAASPSAAPTAEASAAPSEAPSAPGGGADASAVTIKGFAFAPVDLKVKTGTTVTWTNEDSASHTVTFEGGLDSGSFGQGGTYERTFDAPGAFAYKCSIHPSMKGTVTVAD